LTNHAVAIAPWQFQDVTWKIDNARFRKIFRQSTNLDVPDLADNNGEVTSRDEPVSVVHARAEREDTFHRRREIRTRATLRALRPMFHVR
jgi:hypothetical protein